MPQEYIDNSPYIFRESAGGINIGNCSTETQKIFGGSIVWNQLSNYTGVPDATISNVVRTNNNDGSFSLNGQANGTAFVKLSMNFNIEKNHVFILWGCVSGGSTNTYRIDARYENGDSQGQLLDTTALDIGNGAIGKSSSSTSSTEGAVYARVQSGYTINKNFAPVFIDITKLLGSAVANEIYQKERSSAGSGVKFFKDLFPKSYYVYCPGNIESVNVSEHIMRDNQGHIIGRYGLDSNLTLRGIPKLDEDNNIYYDGDIYLNSGTVIRNYGIRAYQSGDESLDNAITDGINTVYQLSNSDTDWGLSYTENQHVVADGTEEYVDYGVKSGLRDVSIPVGHETTYAVSDAVKYNNLYKQPLLKKMTIEVLNTIGPVTIENENIVSEEMSLTKSLCSEANLRYGRCESACFKIRIANISISDLTGYELKVYQEVVTDTEGYLLTQDRKYLLTEDGKKIKLKDTDVEDARVTLGRFKVYSDKPTNDRMWRDLVCYDLMYDIIHLNASTWYESLNFPISIEDLRHGFAATFFITRDVSSTRLINDSLVVEKGFIADGSLSGKTILEAICELNGVFGYINEDGNLDYMTLAYADEVTLDYYQDGTGSYEDYETECITGVRAIGSNSDAGTTVGTTDNLYIIENNPLIYGIEGTPELENALQNLLGIIENDSFRPFKVTTYGNPMLPLGTKITVNTRNKTVVSNVITKEMKGIQSLKDTYEAKSEKVQPKNTNSVANDIKRTKGQIVLKVDANGRIVQAMLSADADTGSEFKVQADNISFIANDTIDLESANLSIKADNFYINPDGSFGSSDGTNPTFSVAANGNVYVKGNINATYGSIGGLTISIGGIYYKDSTKYSGFSSGIWVLGAGATSTDYSGAPFRVNTGGITVIDTLYIKGTSGTPNLYEPLHMSDVGGYAQLAFGNISSSEYTIIMTGNDGGASFKGDLTVRGAKNRVVKTNEYGDRLLYCYETPTPMFGDIGEGKIAEDGKCYVWLDSTFSETIKTESYQVFLQKYGQGECYVTERTSRYFVVEGDIGMVFGWEIKARQAGFENLRLENYYEPNTEDVSINYGSEANEYLKMIKTEREVA